ncbi:MAG: DNA-directed RNA polymerase subunit L [Crenarchaeota archaeon]|nr:DNA-directed RNA polymerase subunit L [Thermoproteota archaeon]
MVEVLAKPEIEVRGEREVRVKIPGESHTLGNLITKIAAQKKGVTALYLVEHPLRQVLWITIRTDGKEDPYKVLLEAIDEAIKYLEKFVRELEEARE